MSNTEETCFNLLKSLNNSNQNFVLKITPFSTKITVKNSQVIRYNNAQYETNSTEADAFISIDDKTFEARTVALEIENNYLKEELRNAKKASEKSILYEVDLLEKIDSKSKEIEALQNALQTTDLKLKAALADFSRKLAENRTFYEENLTELRNFKASRIADDKKKKKVEKKALRKERKAKLKALAKAMEKTGSNSTQHGDSEEPRIS